MAILAQGDGFLGTTNAGAVGTYAMWRRNFVAEYGDTVAAGTFDTAGSALRQISAGGGAFTMEARSDAFANFSGTWRCMGQIGAGTSQGDASPPSSATIFLRIA